MRIFEKIMPLCLALFFCRTVFIGYKYLFFLTLVPCVVYSAYWLLKNGIAKPKSGKVLLPLMVIALFFAHFAPLSNVVKESVNLLLLLYFVAFADLYFAGEKTEPFLKWILRLTMLAGLIAIVRFVLVMLGVRMPLGDELFEGVGFTLVNDCNFYALFFILSIILSVRFYVNKKINAKDLFVISIISVTNIAAVMSRRGYVLYILIVMVMMSLVLQKRYDLKKMSLYNIIAICIVAIVWVIVLFYSSVWYTPDMSSHYKNRYYKMYSLFCNGISLSEFDIKQQRKYYKGSHIDNNLFYNGGLRSGLKYWRAEHNPPDSIIITFHEEEKEPFIRIEKKNSIYGWSLRYMGRPIYYKEGVEYVYSFKYRVIQGGGEPFKVGLWVRESSGYIDDLKKETHPFDSVWSICVVKHVFENDQLNPTCFLNAQLPNTIIDVKDIRLTCEGNPELPHYVDQLPDSVIHGFFAKESADTINYFTAPRIDRWRYAIELWQTRYDTKQKIFGQGFKYLEWYGERFWKNPDRHDFPHNPIISSFLYSGIIGGVVYIIFLIMSLWLYWKKRQQLGIFFIMYLCCMFFSMFSGSSHFSFPLFAFLSFLPFVETGRKTVSVTEK
ncbi:MAG: hypothetical protein J6X32_03480 [Salinivirgaceae bacterium]|nr:hypothetical protein [Salinivirgaceae bacterium]